MPSQRLMIVEDDTATRNLLKQVLEAEGYQVTATDDGLDAINILQRRGLPHLILLDIGLPTLNGFEVGEKVKKMGDVPIIFLTGNRSEESIVTGIRRYADDYITKPFMVREVLARIERVLSRVEDKSYADERATVIDGHLSIDFPNNELTMDGETRSLTPKETGLLHVLVKHRGRPVSPETLIARVWPDEEIYEDALRVHMHRLRNKLKRTTPEKQYIMTERGSGYIFTTPDD